MFVNFKDVFKEDNYKIPKEVIETLNENAPEGLEYKQCNDKIAIKISDCAKSGKILFNDDKILEFEV